MARRRKAGNPLILEAAKPVSLTFKVSAETAKRFRLEALMRGRNNLQLFNEWVAQHCNHVAYKPTRGAGPPADADAA